MEQKPLDRDRMMADARALVDADARQRMDATAALIQQALEQNQTQLVCEVQITPDGRIVASTKIVLA